MQKIITIAFMAAAFSLASAAQAATDESAGNKPAPASRLKSGQECTLVQVGGPNTYHCRGDGSNDLKSVTVGEIYAKGWEIVAATSANSTGAPQRAYLYIEEQ